jgi:hypothetical protein
MSGCKSCVAIVRIEDATLSELADISTEILDRHNIPAGTLLLYGSASHLYQAGTTIYASEWLNLVSNISSRHRDSRILPLTPVLREDCPGVLGRQLIELATWFKKVYYQNILGVGEVWEKLISLIGRTDETGLDLGYMETYTVALPSSLVLGSPLIPTKFRTSSSYTTTRGMDDVMSTEENLQLFCQLSGHFPCRTG